MKKTTWILILIVALVTVRPMSASAINREWSAVLGFLGGVLVANATCPQTVVYERPVVYQSQPIIVQRPIVVEQPVVMEPEIIYKEPELCGHFEYRDEQVWVPGRWIIIDRGRCRRRVWEPGYYCTQMVKVWVPGRPRRCR